MLPMFRDRKEVVSKIKSYAPVVLFVLLAVAAIAYATSKQPGSEQALTGFIFALFCLVLAALVFYPTLREQAEKRAEAKQLEEMKQWLEHLRPTPDSGPEAIYNWSQVDKLYFFDRLIRYLRDGAKLDAEQVSGLWALYESATKTALEYGWRHYYQELKDVFRNLDRFGFEPTALAEENFYAMRV